ncbi:hypothetical protein [Sphingomonas sp. NFR15]|uniref:hypothetical protein n=1 Tax=Sphingomonas sp. NFR15 TaxID=1566282 RepID=UPI00115FAAA2|nr:hypothetical protein [Sphingomonas sp. NFR15]
MTRLVPAMPHHKGLTIFPWHPVVHRDVGPRRNVFEMGATMTLEDMIDLARRSRECAERAQREAAFWQRMIDQRMHAGSAQAEHEAVSAYR